MEPRQFPNPRAGAASSSTPDGEVGGDDRADGGCGGGDGAELRAALGRNLTSLCDHVQSDGFKAGAFSDVIVHSMGTAYYLHRLILSRSSYFRNMLRGPWKEATSPVVNLHVDDDNINAEAITIALAYLYGHHPKLNDSNVFRVLAAACFLDLQDLCIICTNFIISELWTSNFLAYQVFAENQDYGIHGERVRNACWGFLCQSGTMELREVLPRLSSQTLQALLTSDELWVSSEEKRFEVAVYTLLARGSILNSSYPEELSCEVEPRTSTPHDTSLLKGKNLVDETVGQQLTEKDFDGISTQDNFESKVAAHIIVKELADCVVDLHPGASDSESLHVTHGLSCQPVFGSGNSIKREENCSQSSAHLSPDSTRSSQSQVCVMEVDRTQNNKTFTEDLSGEYSRDYSNNSNIWVPTDQSTHCTLPSSFKVVPNTLGRYSGVSSSWGCRMVGKSHSTSFVKGNCGVSDEDYDAFVNIFEGGSLLYCNMSFEALLNMRKELEGLGFPCKAVNDGLWLQMLLSHRVEEVGADTCKQCWLPSMACSCRQLYGTAAYFKQDHDRNHSLSTLGNVYLTDAQGDGSNLYGPVRVHVRGPNDGLAGIGRGATFVPATGWPPTRFVFSRVPFALGNRNAQQPVSTDDSEGRVDTNGDFPGDGLTALVGFNQGSSAPIENFDRGAESDMHERAAGPSSSVSSGTGASHQMQDCELDNNLEWETAEGAAISLDLRTPLRHFPPFRFGVEFEDVHRLADGQVKHCQEVFYAGSLWKVSVQAFSDEDPQGRRTLGLFLHRRKAELTDPFRKAHLYIDNREKVTARYQLICPSKREVMVFGSFKQTGTLLPKAPKGWGWRTALLFDELPDLLQGGALRIAAVVQLV